MKPSSLRFGDQEIVLHEALDPARAGVVGIAHELADFSLQVEGQPFFGAAGDVMQMAAHRPQERLSPLKAPRFFGRQHAKIDKLTDIVDAINVFGDPEQRMQVAQPALAFLDVGFELIAAVADALVPGIALGELGLDKLRRRVAHDVGLEAAPQIGEQRLLAPDIARLEERRADRQIGFGVAQTFIDRARRVPDLEPQIPQHVEQVLDHLLGMRGALVGQQEQ